MPRELQPSRPIGYYEGQFFNFWKILREFHKEFPTGKKKKRPFVIAECACGTIKEVARHSVITGTSKSCGCMGKRSFKKMQDAQLKTKHRYRRDDPRINMYHNAKSRARLKRLPFKITPEDIVIPEFCPLLGIPLLRVKEKNAASNPSLDRIIPNLGYVPSNIQVISYRANTLKRDCDLRELQTLVKNWEKLTESTG
jgi:hypothetical protein